MPSKKKKQGKRKRRAKKPARVLRSFFLFMLGLCGLAGVSIYLGYTSIRSSLPPIFSFSDYQETSVQMSKVLGADGSTVGVFFEERRSVVPLEVISPLLQHAILTAEDRDFYTHGGLDFLSIGRALWKDVLAGSYVQGGSTITQQVAKTFYLSSEKTIARKVREAVLAYALEQELTKDDIFALYLNQIYFGHGRYGVAEATRFYFAKEPQAVTLDEAASLAALIRSPERLSPFKYPEKNRMIRDRIIHGMFDLGFIDDTQRIAAQEKPIARRKVQSDSPDWAAYYVDAVRRKLQGELSPAALRRGGYRIHTEMNPGAQKEVAQQLAGQPMASTLGDLQCAFVHVESGTGAVKVLLGGRNFTQSSFNRAIQSKRSIGSIVKPFLFAYGFAEGKMTSESVFPNEKREYAIPGQKAWSPRNFDAKYDGEDWTLEDALVFSVNTISAQVLEAVGVEEFAAFLNRIFPGYQVGAYLSNSLGAFGSSPLDVARAFSIFPSRGMLPEHGIIRRVIDRGGKNVWDTLPRRRRVLGQSETVAIEKMMGQVVERGTGRKAAIPGKTVYGKTGTSNGAVDSWFAGYVGENVGVLWLGKDDNTPVKRGGGGALAAPVWGSLMKRALGHLP